MHINDEIKKNILEKATLHNTLVHYHGLSKKKGAQFVMDCPKCGKPDKLEYNEAKQVAKCFSCDLGVKLPANYLMKFQGMTFPQALEELASIESIALKEEPATRKSLCTNCDKETEQFQQYNIKTESEDDTSWFCKSCNKPVYKNKKEIKVKKKFKPNKDSQVPYVQLMLDGSGLTTEDITGSVYIDEDTREERPAYTQGTVDSAFEIVPGDDVIIHYYDLEGRPMTYYRKDQKGNPTGKPKRFYRVRYQNPELHKDKKDNAVKYRSPWGSDSKIYLNKWIREKYKKSSRIKILYVQEGEKKADKATKHGLISVGIMGIHNIAYKQTLPVEFEMLIKRCQVEKIVFVLDEDWNNLSRRIDSKHSADNRPKSFFRAVLNFQKHFYSFTNIDIHLGIYFGYVNSNKENDKGIDDLLVNSLRGKENELKNLCDKALKEPKGDANWLQFHDITTMPQYKIKEFWHLNSIDSFVNHYKEELKGVPKFKYNNIEWRFNKEGVRELAQPLMPMEQFWTENKKEDHSGNVISRKYSFNHKRCYTFLQNRGYYLLEQPNNSYIWVHIEGNVVNRVEPFQIKNFVTSFAEQIDNEDVENMLYRGGKMYLGADSLGNMKYTQLQLHAPSKNMQYLYFSNSYFKVTDEGITQEEIKNLSGQVWKDNIKDFVPTKTEQLLINEVTCITEQDAADNEELRNYIGEYAIDFSAEGDKCHFLQFLLNTSIYFGKDKTFSEATYDEKFETTRHLLSKITAFGYMLHRFRMPGVEKAVVGMDGTMSEVGKSNGRSGKSLLGMALEHLVPTVTIPGKKKDLLEDKFLFEEVDQRTGGIFFDDVRGNFDFEFLFPYITGKFTLEKKGLGKMTLSKEFVQKFYIATNHALRGEGGSFEDRQFLLGFSNWYNVNHKPIDDFKVMFFDEWNEEQWNLFYNFAAMALHFYFKHGLIEAPSEKLLNRKMRQEMGEQFLDWAEEYFSNPANVNCQIYKDLMYQGKMADVDFIKHGEGFITKYPGQRKYNPIQNFKSKIKLFCKFKKYEYNPSKKGNDIKKGGKEYISVHVPDEALAELKSNTPPTPEEDVVGDLSPY